MGRLRFLLVVLVAALLTGQGSHAQNPKPAAGANVGSIAGQVVKGKRGIGGVTVLIAETKAVEVTNQSGRFSFKNVPRGTYTLLFTMGDNNETRPGIEVGDGLTTEIKVEVEWDTGLLETLTVYSVSKRMEKIVDAPAAITVVPESVIEMEASTGQVPKLLEFTPGAEITQSGIYDFNVNTRGFNSSVNRRVATYLDGRDMSAPFLGAQEWSALSTPIDDLANLEFIRGPSAALYGRNSSAGVINMRSKAPRDSLGGTVRMTTNVGDVDTTNTDIRWAHSLGNGWYTKVVAGMRYGDDFSVNRNNLGTPLNPILQAEYATSCGFTDAGDPVLDAFNCLPVEASPITVDENEIYSGVIRFDKYFTDQQVLTLEGGYADITGPVFQTGIGRVETIKSERPYFRANWGSRHFNAIAYFAGRDAQQLSLQSGEDLYTDTERWSTEVQTNWDVGGGKGRIVGGLMYTLEKVDTLNPETGKQSLLGVPVEEDYSAVFGQFDWKFSDQFKVVAAGRFDDSSLYQDPQFSPKLAAVWSITPSHSLRFTYNEAFQVGNYSEFFLRADVLEPQDLSGLANLWCNSTNPPVECGIGETRFLAVGNENLELETTEAWEVGYSAIIGKKAFITLDYYNARNENFITDLLFQCQAPLRQPGDPDFFLPRCGSDVLPEDLTNPDFGPWKVPEGLPNPPVFGGFTLEDAVNNSFARILGDPNNIILSNDLDGSAVVAALSYSNFGVVDTQGIDLGVNYYIKDWLNVQFTYSWFDFEPVIPSDATPDQAERIRERLVPNTPENKFAIGINYNKGKWTAGAGYRWTEDFPWSAGIFKGNVSCEAQPAPCPGDPYTLLDLNAGYAINPNWQIGLNIANAVDNARNQAFGGDLIGRRALLSAAYTWTPGE